MKKIWQRSLAICLAAIVGLGGAGTLTTVGLGQAEAAVTSDYRSGRAQREVDQENQRHRQRSEELQRQKQASEREQRDIERQRQQKSYFFKK